MRGAVDPVRVAPQMPQGALQMRPSHLPAREPEVSRASEPRELAVKLLAEIAHVRSGLRVVPSHDLELVIDPSHARERRTNLGGVRVPRAQCDHGHGHRDEGDRATRGGRS
jgi:hypothetical protein